MSDIRASADGGGTRSYSGGVKAEELQRRSYSGGVKAEIGVLVEYGRGWYRYRLAPMRNLSKEIIDLPLNTLRNLPAM